MSSPEYVAYRQCIPEINSTVANNVGLEWCATELLEAVIIADTVANKMGVLGVDNLQKANVLTSAISSRLKSDPDSFLTVITIMKKEPAFAHVLEELSKAYEGDSKAIKSALKSTSSGESDRQALKDLPLTLPNVLNELDEVTDSHQLGLNLGVCLSELTALEQNYPRDAVRQKTETLSYWLDDEEDPSWEKIASAVEKRHRSLARKIRGEKQTSGSPPPQSPRTPQPPAVDETCVSVSY